MEEFNAKLLTELKGIKALLAELMGSSDLPIKERFSKPAVEKAAKEFSKLLSERAEWLDDHELSKYFKDVYSGSGEFIRQEFGFNAFFKHGRYHYYKRTEVKALADLLKARNVNLKRLMELRAGRAAFLKSLASVKAKKSKFPYVLPDDLRDIRNDNPPAPDVAVVKADLERLETEFFEQKLEPYIDIYEGNYGMVKFEYHYAKYISPDIRSKAKRGCEQFNYANHAMELLTKKKSKFIPVKEEDQIQL